LQISPNIYIDHEVNKEIVKTDPRANSLKSLLDSANVNRTDLMTAKDNLLLSRQNYTLPKALAVPDITISRNGFLCRPLLLNQLKYLTCRLFCIGNWGSTKRTGLFSA